MTREPKRELKLVPIRYEDGTVRFIGKIAPERYAKAESAVKGVVRELRLTYDERFFLYTALHDEVLEHLLKVGP